MFGNIGKWSRKMTYQKKANFRLDQAVRFITGLMVEERARKKTLLNDEDEAYYNNLIKVSKGYDLVGQTKLNLICCFLKDNQFSSDSETRILALPKNNNGINTKEEWLKIPFYKDKLKKIRVSPDIQDKEDLKKNLEETLLENGYQNVIVE